MVNFSEQLKKLKRKTNRSGTDLAFELGIKDSYFSQLLNGKKEPPQHSPLRRVVERMLAAPVSEPGMETLAVEIPERLYIAAVEAARAQSFPSIDEYVAQLIRNDTVTTIRVAQGTGPGAQSQKGIKKYPANSAPKKQSAI